METIGDSDLEAVLLHDPEALRNVPQLDVALEAGLRLQAKLLLEAEQGRVDYYGARGCSVCIAGLPTLFAECPVH